MNVKNLKNESGQGLIEYLVIVALVAVAGIAVMSVVGQNVRAQFANVASAIQGKSSSSIKLDEVRKSQYQKRDMGDFFRGSVKRQNNQSSSEGED